MQGKEINKILLIHINIYNNEYQKNILIHSKRRWKIV